METLFFVLCLFCSVNCMDEMQFISVNPSNQRFLDEEGRERFFHGTNIVVKHFPWHPQPEGFAPETFSEQDMELMQSLGLNVVRLGLMWAGVEPTRGEYNMTYLQTIEEMVKKSAKYGIYILLDMHQDVMSRKFCVEGFPDWVVNTGNARDFPEPLHAPFSLDPVTNYPSDEDCAKFSWSAYYATEAASVAFQNLYNNTDGLLDSWAAFWSKSAETFRDYSNVIGYELINEPWSGDIYANPLLMVPKVADKQNFAPAYEVLNEAIRAKDDRHCIFFEPVTWDDFGVGFEEVPGGPDYKNRSVLSYHYYDLPSGPVEINFMIRQRDLKRLQCGGMMTEFLTSYGEMESTLKTMSVADKHLQSWIGWDYRPYYPTNQDVPNESRWKGRWKADRLGGAIYVNSTSRTYPQAVAGHTKSFSFDPTTKEFHLRYVITSDCKSSRTEIYFNHDQYMSVGGGFLVSITPEESAKWSNPSKNMIIVENIATSGRIDVNIRAGQPRSVFGLPSKEHDML